MRDGPGVESLVGGLTGQNQSVALTNSDIQEWLVGHVHPKTPACSFSYECDSSGAPSGS
jgi:hypothetical protein